MISVPSPRLRLSGSKLYFLILALVIVSCSKKTVPVVSVPPKAKPPVREQPVKESAKKAAVHSVALLLPFHLDKVNPRSAELKEIRKAELAIDFFQGVKLALDSLSREGYNFKLQVFDSQEDELHMVNLARAKSVLSNELIIGPVFPESIKIFSEFADLQHKLEISPLAAADPDQFKNPNLVSITNNIGQHGRKIADFINSNYKPENVNLILINTRSSDDDKFATPFKSFLTELSGKKFIIKERPNSIGLEEDLSQSKTNLVIIASASRDFILPTIDRLYKVSQAGSKIEVFGHPYWVKAQFLNAEKMQWLNTRITSSYFIDYKSTRVKSFIARYLRDYGTDPSEYAFKGFDNGYFFGKLLALYGDKYADHLTDEQYEGLHNDFRFVRDEKSGFLNTELMILKYQGFELQPEK